MERHAALLASGVVLEVGLGLRTTVPESLSRLGLRGFFTQSRLGLGLGRLGRLGIFNADQSRLSHLEANLN